MGKQGKGALGKIGSIKLPLLPQRNRDLSARLKGKLCFAFDFGEYATKVVVGKTGKDAAEVRQMLLVENGERKAKLDSGNLKEWKANLSRAFTQNNLNPSGQMGLCMVNSRNYISRLIEIPFADDHDRQGLVAYEMSQSLSLDIDAHLFQHKVMRTYDKDGVKMCTVWAAAVPKQLCELYYQLLESLKLQPAVMDVSANGMERLFAADQTLHAAASQSTVATVDYGMRGTEVNIFDQGRYVLGSFIERGDGKLVAAAKNALGAQISDIHNGNRLIIPPQKVYEIMSKSGQSEMAQLFVTTVEEWLSDINEAVKRYNVTYPSKPIAQLLLYGGSPQLVWLRAYLEKYLRIPTSIVQASDRFQLSGKIDSAGKPVAQFLNALNLLLIR